MVVATVLFSELYTGSVANVSASRAAGLHCHHHTISPVSRPGHSLLPRSLSLSLTARIVLHGR